VFKCENHVIVIVIVIFIVVCDTSNAYLTLPPQRCQNSRSW